MKRKADPQGRTQTASAKKKFSLISDETLLALHANLVKGRMLEERLGSKAARRTDVSLRGYEAATVGVAMDLIAADTLICSSGNVLPRFLHGEGLKSLAANGRGRHKERDLVPLLHAAVGSALVHKAGKSAKVVMAFRRDGEMDGWQEAQEIAAAHSLPMIFVSQAELSETRSAGRNGGRGVAAKARANGKLPESELPRIVVDGSDVVAVYRVAHEAIERARRDRGPTLIECRPFRVPGHRRGDSIANMRAYLRSKGLFSPRCDAEMAESFGQELRAAMKSGRPSGSRQKPGLLSH